MATTNRQHDFSATIFGIRNSFFCILLLLLCHDDNLSVVFVVCSPPVATRTTEYLGFCDIVETHLCFDRIHLFWALSIATMSAAADVKQLKESLVKELPAETDEAVERCRDILQRLQEIDVSVQILSDTMIGKTVVQLKAHDELGPAAKALVKKWKQVAKGNATAPAAAAAAAPKTEKPVRRQSTLDDPPEDFTTQLLYLSPLRQNICIKYFEIFQNVKQDLVKSGVNESAIAHLLGPRAIELEASIWKNFTDKKAYADRARSLAFNMKKNHDMTQEVILGQIETDRLVKMKTEELASQELRSKREKVAKEVNDSKRMDWDQANEHKINEMCGIKGELLKASLFTCGRCKSTKTTSTQKQTRSGKFERFLSPERWFGAVFGPRTVVQ